MTKLVSGRLPSGTADKPGLYDNPLAQELISQLRLLSFVRWISASYLTSDGGDKRKRSVQYLKRDDRVRVWVSEPGRPSRIFTVHTSEPDKLANWIAGTLPLQGVEVVDKDQV